MLLKWFISKPNLRIVLKLLCEEPNNMEPRVLHHGISNMERTQTVWNSWETFRRTEQFIFKVTLTIVILDWVSYTFSTLHFHPVPSLFSSSVSPFVILSFLLFCSLFFFLLFFLSLSLFPLSVWLQIFPIFILSPF